VREASQTSPHFPVALLCTDGDGCEPIPLSRSPQMPTVSSPRGTHRRVLSGTASVNRNEATARSVTVIAVYALSPRMSSLSDIGVLFRARSTIVVPAGFLARSLERSRLSQVRARSQRDGWHRWPRPSRYRGPSRVGRRGRLSSGSLGADRPGGPERCGRYALFDSPTRRTGRAR